MNSFNKIPYKAVIVLFSKIIIKRLSRDQLNIFRKVEKITKSFINLWLCYYGQVNTFGVPFILLLMVPYLQLSYLYMLITYSVILCIW